VSTLQTNSPADEDSALLAKRRKRIRDFETESLDKSNALDAALGGVVSDLMMWMLDLREGLKQARGQKSDPVEQLSLLLPCLNQMSTMSKQLESLLKLHIWSQDRRLLAESMRMQAQAKKNPIGQAVGSPAHSAGPLAQVPGTKTKPR